MISADVHNARSFTPLPLVARAELGDAAAIAWLLRRLAPETIPVPENEIRCDIDRYRVVRQGDEIVATAALMPLDRNHLELRSVAVDPECGGRGLGTQLVSALQWEVLLQGRHLRCVTVNPGFFERMGFSRIPMRRVPPKPGRDDCTAGRARVAMEWRPKSYREKGNDDDQPELDSLHSNLLLQA